MSGIVVIQARTTSSRLPGKVLLPIKGIPLVVLAAQRASNTGRTVIVLTSDNQTDDGLVALLEDYGLKYFRGSLENVLDRVVKALVMYDDKTVVFRLTADNIFPDGTLLDEIEDEFIAKGYEYLCCNGEPSGLPYGVSVEVTRLDNLREAALMSAAPYDLEHVTPYVKRRHDVEFFEKYKQFKMGHFRCTVDCLDDYINIQNIFSSVIDPAQESFLQLIRRLDQASFQPLCELPVPKLVFGAAQLGSDYGITNITGQPSLFDCQQLLKTAIGNGVEYIDTARVYGNSEAMIGLSLKDGWASRAKVITKLTPLHDCVGDAPKSILDAFVDASIYKSCSLLRVQKIDVLMLHRASDMFDWDGKIWHRLLELKLAGVIEELGVSVQSPEELSMVLSNADVRYIQLPFNILDWRWDSIIPEILTIKKKRNLTIHVRSVLLQGLLTSLDDSHWLRANVDKPKTIKDWLIEQVNICERVSIADLCLSYVNTLTWIDGIVVGMENMNQLIKNINYFNSYPLSASQVANIHTSRPRLTAATLNPALWIKKHNEKRRQHF